MAAKSIIIIDNVTNNDNTLRRGHLLMRVDLLIHPIRLRIIQALGQDRLTTQELAERLPEVPLSSLYRHLQLLRRGDVLDVVEERLVNGIEEKVYAVTGRTHLEPGGDGAIRWRRAR
jgi:DNA-binding transcriptional ArsR family regulator